MPNYTPEDAGYFLDEYDGPRFWEHVSFRGGQEYLNDPLARITVEHGECWPWSGWNTAGDTPYGKMRIFGGVMPAHAIGYREFGGNIPDGFDVDHLCRNTMCVRHNHLEPVSRSENVRRGMLVSRPVCGNGHIMTDANTGLLIAGKASKRCRDCVNESKRRSYDKALAAAGKQRRYYSKNNPL